MGSQLKVKSISQDAMKQGIKKKITLINSRTAKTSRGSSQEIKREHCQHQDCNPPFREHQAPVQQGAGVCIPRSESKQKVPWDRLSRVSQHPQKARQGERRGNETFLPAHVLTQDMSVCISLILILIF